MTFLLGAALILVSTGCLADTWTNAAGHAIEGQAVAIIRNQVVVVVKGSQTTIPLHALSTQSQQHLRDQLQTYEIASQLQATFSVTAEQLDRLKQLKAKGRLAPEEYSSLRKNILEGFRKTAAGMQSVSVRQLSEALIMLRTRSARINRSTLNNVQHVHR